MQTLPLPSAGTIPIVLGLSENFAPYAYTTIQSGLDNILPGVRLAFYLFHEGMSEAVQNIGRALFNTDRSEIHFVDVSEWMNRHNPSYLGHASRPTFYRLAIPELLHNFPRVIYLDSDIFMRRCPSLLYYSIHKDAQIGATRDLLMIPAQHNGFRLPQEVAGGPPLIDYHRGALGVQNSDDYFQGGVLVININKITEHQVKECGALCGTLFWMMDQDILNRIFYGRVCFIHPNWDVCWGPGCEEASENLPDHWRDLYQETLKDPFAIHYTGFPKPWNGWDGPYTDDYRKTLERVMVRF
ncbi:MULTISPECIES: glycosyltransferase family 8 protein [Bombella]|uniref:Glycosyltransferase family 8 protein n=1 Tax=Bombella pollinis TaxID=2967337 RepID=A0ABT3WNK9_9PROT|nr:MULTISPECIES: glycosyltransferase family 8 protein [Bombella]MCX5619424.1 glycosyltransferase family 8 protein [Bombella pollinis]MUG04896.1 hypothetical protein [Bombella sp. ESL0378]MUG90437.1 hypothetical protein [Bombella sp. ESL0385]